MRQTVNQVVALNSTQVLKITLDKETVFAVTSANGVISTWFEGPRKNDELLSNL